MIRRKLKTLELQKTFKASKKKSNTLFPPCETSHEKLKTPKMTRRKLKKI
jgi:hypothetical protein